jgi:hypothetical protein
MPDALSGVFTRETLDFPVDSSAPHDISLAAWHKLAGAKPPPVAETTMSSAIPTP